MAALEQRWPLDRRRITRRICILLSVFALLPASARSSTLDLLQQASSRKKQPFNSTTIDSNSLHVATYRNGYGTRFQCDSSCYFLSFAYLLCVAALLVLLSVIPVQSPQKPEEAPFLLWLGEKRGDNDAAKTPRRRNRHRHRPPRLLDRLSLWLYGEPEESSDEEEPTPVEKEIVVVETVPEPPAKTFESIAVETDDSLMPPPIIITQPAPPAVPPSDVVTVDDVDRLFDPLPKKPAPARKPGIFSPASPRRAKTEISDASLLSGSDSNLDLLAPPPTPSRRGSTSPQRQSITGSSPRRASVVGSPRPTGESLLEAVEKRSSMQKRAEKRKEYAKSDIARDTLRDHELEAYEYLEFVREMLEGTSIKKVCQKSHKVVKRTFFITPDLATVYWNSVGTKAWVVKKSSLETASIDKVLKGIQGTLASKGKQEKQELYVSVVMKDGKRLDLEAKDEATRQRLFLGFSQLASEKREEKRRKDAGETAEVKAPAATETPSRRGSASSQRPSVEQERRSKTEEDDPTKWRQQPEDGAAVVEVTADGENQGDQDGDESIL